VIDCPICNVPNEDMARFCAECGQRLTRPAAPPAAAPSPPAEPPAKAPKLHSPLLGAEIIETARRAEPPRGLRSPLLGETDPGMHQEPPVPGAGRKAHLHSPLLEGDEEEVVDLPPRPAGRGGLRSPLLSGEAPEDYGGAGRPGGLRSPLLGGDEPGFAEPRPGRHGLRSPLLGGEEEEEEYAEPPRPVGRGKLHSPILGGADSVPLGGAYGDFEDDDDPNVLRSPLLAAKLPLPDKPAKPPAEPEKPQRLADQVQKSVGSVAPGSYSSAGAGGQPPAAGSGPEPVPAAAPPRRLAAGPELPGSPARHPGFEPGQPSPAVDPGPGPGAQMPAAPPPAAGSGYQFGLPGPAGGGPAGSPAAAFGSPASPPAASPAPAPPPPVDLSGLRGLSAPQPDGEPGLRKRRFKLLEETEPAEPAPRAGFSAGGRSAEPARPAQPALPGSVKLLVVPLVLAAIVKFLTMQEFVKANQPFMPIIADQAGQLVVIVCLIVICLAAGGSRR